MPGEVNLAQCVSRAEIAVTTTATPPAQGYGTARAPAEEEKPASDAT
jgi:hypothetical protein